MEVVDLETRPRYTVATYILALTREKNLVPSKITPPNAILAPCPTPGHPPSVPLLPALYLSKRTNFRARVGGTQGGAETAGECEGHVRLRGETGAVRRYERLFWSRGDAFCFSFISKALPRKLRTRRRFMAVHSQFAILPPLIMEIEGCNCCF